MASQCKRQQCTIERLGFRQELDSWRHKLIHCVGFESILEGLFGPKLVEDIQLFKDFEPVAVSDWSFDENCLFCCLRRDKVKEHLIGVSSEELEKTPRPLLVKNLSTISRLEKQAEDFLYAVLSKKDVPNFSDPHIPIVAREILQRMIRQFAAEYTSKTSSPQDTSSDSKACSDQSLPIAPLQARASPSTSPATTLAGPAHNQNPVLSKLLMADQDTPLDLTIKKPLAEPSEQDGVLDLSIKKNRYSSNQPLHSSCLSPATSMVKGESTDVRVTKAKDLQSTSTLEQFMAKLCPHHQRQIVDAIGFLQTEVKALASSSTHQASNSTSAIQGTACSTTKLVPVTPEKSSCERSLSLESTPKLEVQDISHSAPSSCTIERVPENAVSLKTSTAACYATDLHSPGLGSNHALVTHTSSPVDLESNHHGNHVPLKMKIMTSNVADGKKLSCVLNTSLSTNSDTLEDRQVNTILSNKTEVHSARLSSSVKRLNQVSHPYQVRHKETLGQAKDTPAKMISVHVTIPSDSPRTARKTFRASSDNRTRDSACRGMADPDLGHCDIVFIDKPITECFKEQQRSVLPRRNARKSTRGHMYSDEIWELKTVRTLAGRGNCPNPMPELITLVTPKQILSKPEGVPPVDMPFVGPCREMNQQMPTEELDESIIPGSGDMVEVAVSEIDVIVETSQTDQLENKGQSPLLSLISSPTENKKEGLNTDVEQDTNADLEMTANSEGSAAQALFKQDEYNQTDVQEDLCEQIQEVTVTEPANITIEEAEPQLSSNTLYNNQPLLHQTRVPSPPSSVNEINKENEEIHDEEPLKLQSEAQADSNSEMRENLNKTEKPVVKETEIKTSDAVVNSVRALETDNNDSDVSSKTLDALLKELPPWRRKRGSIISPPKLRQTETVIVGYVNGRPISASDRSLRRRSSNSITSPVKNTVHSSQNVPNKTSSNLPIRSTVESKSVEQPPRETHKPVKSMETAPVIDHLTELSSDIVSDTTSKILSMTKQIQKQKRTQKDKDNLPVLCDQPADCPQSAESTRQLRSASQKLSGSLLPLPTVHSVSPKPTATHTLPSTEQDSPLSMPSPLSVSSPVMPLTIAAPEQSQQNISTESPVEQNLEKPQLVETISKTKQKNEVEFRIEAKQKLRSAKVADNSQNEKLELIAERSSPLESQSPVKTETQTQTPLRNKRFLRKDAETIDVLMPEKPNVVCSENRLGSGSDSSCSMLDKPTRMPLRSESSKTEMFHLSVSHSGQVDNKKVAMKSPRLTAPSTSALTVTGRQTDVASPIRIMPERITKAQGKPSLLSVKSALPKSTVMPVIAPRPEPKQTANKFFETLTGEESQHLITNLNIKYDKMQKGWVQMDKEGQPGTKYKSKADRQAAIWKSKRRTRKPKSSEHQKYSPVQMLFMKGFNLTSICRWFLESTETKSLVIVKKVNTRLPSETQLCFHSSSSASGTSQGVFPSIQAERLKKHLKKFAIASPVKSNPKSQKLIAKALQQDANAAKGKERKEISSTTQTLSKPHTSAQACKKIGESQKSSGKSKNPASARILRKYSNIREKLQVHQTSVRLKKVSKALKSNNMKRLHTTKSTAKSCLKAGKSPLPVSKKMRASAAKLERRKAMGSKKNTKRPVQEKVVKAQSSGRASRITTKKELPKRWSQRLGSLKIFDHTPAYTCKSNVDSKKTFEAQKSEVEKTASRMNGAKIQTKESSQSTLAEVKGTENAVEISKPNVDVKAPTSPDQVLTRSQRKMEMAVPLSGSPSQVSKRVSKTVTTKNVSPKIVRKAEEPTLTRSGALKTSLKRSRAALLPRSAAKRVQESSEAPAKRTRTSFSK